MRSKRMLIVFLAIASVPALAAKSTTVEQLRQTLAANETAHQSDDVLMQQIANTRLTARLSPGALRQLVALSPGPKTTQTLHAIADIAAFLDPPPDEIPATPPPGAAEQSAIFERTLHYVVHIQPALPNFLATRVTEHYVDTMRGLEEQEAVQRGGLYLLGVHQAPISYRDGRETDDPTIAYASAASEKSDHGKGAKPNSSADHLGGLSSWGEFGPILKVVLGDSIKGKLTWERWELADGKPAAVYQFVVDRPNSHYGVSYCCEIMTEATDAGLLQAKRPVLLRQIGYHGNLEVDPETGAILRLTIETDLQPQDPIQRAAMMVEYGPVKIGENTQICPIHSVSATVSRIEVKSHGEVDSSRRMLLNDVQFTDYHRFGSESTLITELPPATGNSPQPAPALPETAAATAPVKASPIPLEPATPGESAAANPPSQVTQAPSATRATAQSEVHKEIQVQPNVGLPALASNTQTSDTPATGGNDSSSFTLKVTTRSVDVGLIATDKHGKPIIDLKQDEVDLYDNGRKQQLISFHHAIPGAPAPAPAPQLPETPADTFTNAAPASAELQNAPDLLILLLDESHLAYLDLNRARNEILNFLAASRPTSRIALYSMSEQGFHVIQDVTQDHAQVIARLKAWTPHIQAVSQAQAQPSRPSSTKPLYTSSDSLDTSDLQGNPVGIPVAVLSSNLPLRYALQDLTALARHFASVPGRKSIAWISGDAALASWVGMKGNPQLDAAIQHTQEALNEARIALYAVDASSANLGPGGFDASVVNPNGDMLAIQNGPSAPRLAPSPTMSQQDPLGIQAPARQLAESTGGRAVNKGRDLKDVLEDIDQDSASRYELGFDPDTPADNKFHTVQVKVPQRKNVALCYRTGYLYSEDSASTQQRFQQVVWSPQDAAGIALTAEAVRATDAASGKSTIKLRIAFPGLSLGQKDDRWTDRLYVFVAIRDDAEQKAEVSGETMNLALNQSTYDSGLPAGIPYQRAVEVNPRLGSVRVIVVDGNSGKTGSVTLPSSAFQP
jgi:VWFA-related protein